MDEGRSSIGMVGRMKSMASSWTREVVRLAREVCGGNGIIVDYQVINRLLDIEAAHTFEGTYEVNALVSGRELTGGIAAFK